MRKYHVFSIDDNNCVIDIENNDFFIVRDELAERLRLVQNTEKGKDCRLDRGTPLKCHRLTINVTSRCNLCCSYCYANGGKYQAEYSRSAISVNTVINAVDKVLELYPEGIEMIQLFGGEPLLEENRLKEIIENIKQFCQNRNVQAPDFAMVTNGTLINEQNASFIVNNLVSLTISLDGSKKVNDRNRILPGGESVYDKVKASVGLLKSLKSDFYVCCEATVTGENVLDYIKTGEDNLYKPIYEDVGFDRCLANPVLDLGSGEELPYGAYETYFDNYEKMIFSHPEMKSCILEKSKIYDIFVKKNKAQCRCGSFISDLCVDVEGNLYPCFMFIGESEFLIGNADSDSQEHIRKRYSEILEKLAQANDNEECRNCWAFNFCALTPSGCIAGRYLKNGSIKTPVKELCEIGKKRLERILWECARSAKK